MDLRTAGVLVILSTPVSSIVSFAASATVLGEDRLEDGQGLTTLGWASIVLPPLLGAALIGWSFTGRPAPATGRLRSIGLVLGVAILLLGGVATVTAPSGDPSIGGGVLILVGLATAVAAIVGGGPDPG